MNIENCENLVRKIVSKIPVFLSNIFILKPKIALSHSSMINLSRREVLK